ncbi:hypothetical protein ACFX1R_042809 [Malus domestica]
MGGETTYGPEEATMHGRFGYPPPRQHYSSIFDEENPNGCSIIFSPLTRLYNGQWNCTPSRRWFWLENGRNYGRE